MQQVQLANKEWLAAKQLLVKGETEQVVQLVAKHAKLITHEVNPEKSLLLVAIKLNYASCLQALGANNKAVVNKQDVNVHEIVYFNILRVKVPFITLVIWIMRKLSKYYWHVPH